MPKVTDNAPLTDLATFNVSDMRVLASDNEDVAFVVKGTSIERNGSPIKSTSIVVTVEDALHPAFALDIEAGTFTVPAGKRGRKASPGLSQDDIAARIASLR